MGFHIAVNKYKFDNSSHLGIVFHDTSEAEPKQFSFSKRSHSLESMVWRWTRS